MSTVDTNNTQQQSFYEAIYGKDNSTGRKVSVGANGDKVVNPGDESIFKKSSEDMGKDQFLTLLVAQLQHQDPMNPAEDTQFVAQLAQFSQLEFTQNSTKAISTLAENMTAFMEMQSLQAQSVTNASATPLLGKEVRVMETSYDHKGSTEKEFNVHLMEGFNRGTLVLRDGDGNTVAEVDFAAENSKGNDLTVKWDGKNAEGEVIKLNGKFSIEILDATGAKTAGYAYQEGIVTGVSFSSSGAALTVNGQKYGLGYLVNVDEEGNIAKANSAIKAISESVVKALMKDEDLDSDEAYEKYYDSDTYKKLKDTKSGLHTSPWQEIYEMLKKEFA